LILSQQLTAPQLCACMGPMYNEPHCYCKMKQLGLPLNETDRNKDEKQFKEAIKNIFPIVKENNDT
jgi:hypothetical protein